MLGCKWLCTGSAGHLSSRWLSGALSRPFKRQPPPLHLSDCVLLEDVYFQAPPAPLGVLENQDRVAEEHLLLLRTPHVGLTGHFVRQQRLRNLKMAGRSSLTGGGGVFIAG